MKLELALVAFGACAVSADRYRMAEYRSPWDDDNDDPFTWKVKYGCYRSSCFRYCRDESSKGSGNWCYTASKGGAYISCSKDSDCDATWKVSSCKYDDFQKC